MMLINFSENCSDFFLQIFSISGLMQLRSKTLKTLAAKEVRVMPLYFLVIFREGEDLAIYIYFF